VIAIIYGRYAWKRLYSPQPGDTKTVTLVVQQGDTLNTIAAKLHKEGLLGGFMGLDDRFLLRYLGHVNENANKIKPGAYRLESSQSLNDVYLRLIKGSQDFKITIPEGKTGREVAAEVKRRYKDFNDARFLELLNDKAFIATLKMDVPSLEGYLYPSTYFFGPGMKEEELVQQMVGLFQKRVEDSLKNVDKQDTFTFHEHLVMASLIEKEARMDEDRPLIASVIFNRLEKGMPLQIDATINYALNDWRRLSYADLKIDSPYNTYKNKGLPPGPIANPRMQSLLATFTAPKTDYLYYVYQGNGRHAFSASYEEFLKNKRLYLKDQAEAAGSEETTATGGQNEQKPANDVSEKVPARSGTPPARRTRRQ